MSKAEFLQKNLEIRWAIAEMLPMLDAKALKKYQEFFRYTEKLEKRG